MKIGEIDRSGEAVVTVRLRGPASMVTLSVVVDTGFTDWLTLPRETRTLIAA